ncbi:molybdenum cofactor cytidylyltransferase [Microbacterium terrae]|uniref:Nicotine blue oxidoreductase n=1 Tax=Microbacterium terrae TaxID=69369 RepID=A0A0M2HIU0_9MICO|nr:nucleotidyltransferase family protein [Microbacterium terrae]KJL44227.1 Nicotine blue oxidoreductase [Microbacterium terrae]MBP1078767.1 molybdenum cofactor cytidylyltransferase [Microbacterium terrae]GLJ98168.1 molybdopterin-guanine dinucleotide biosynthesis protein MobA [Microbacterium terrae]
MLVGLVLAAGAGTRFGGPKGLARDAGGAPWTVIAVDVLRRAGCDRVVVAVGACADEVAALVPPVAEVVVVADWADGMAASLRAGLSAALAPGGAEAVVIVPVDTPELPASAVRRVVSALGDGVAGGLAQAVYGGRPGHPVVIGAEHVDAVIATITGDRGARGYLRRHGVVEVECSDLWSGDDHDQRA